MNTHKDTDFIMEIFATPPELDGKNLTIQHELIDDWDYVGSDIVNGEYLSHVILHMERPCTLKEFEGEVSVHSNIHTVQGVDVFLHYFSEPRAN